MNFPKNSVLALLIVFVTGAAAAQSDENALKFIYGIDAYHSGDYETAVTNLKPLAEQGDAQAQFALGCMYQNGWGVTKDDQQSDSWYRRAVRGAQDSFAFAAPLEDEQAAPCFRKAAQHGVAGAQFDLGLLYANGLGVPQDYEQAAAWFQKAAKQGNAGAQSNLGVLYANGHGLTQDYEQALAWYRKAAEQRDAFGQFHLGLLYANGQGVPQDYEQAAVWYRKAAEQENALAQFDLGLLYANGQGVAQDYEQAAAWFRKAADQENAIAQYNIGVLYANGQGVPQDYIQAHMWANLAAAQISPGGYKRENMIDLRDTLEQKMTREQIAKAQRLARAWQPIWLRPFSEALKKFVDE